MILRRKDSLRCFIFSTARKSPWGIYLRHLKINTRLIPVSKLVWNRTFALFDEYCETDMFLPAIFNVTQTFLKIFQFATNYTPIYGCISLVQNKKTFISFRLTCFTSRIKLKVAIFKLGSATFPPPPPNVSSDCSAIHDAATRWCHGAAFKKFQWVLKSITFIVEFNFTGFLQRFL